MFDIKLLSSGIVFAPANIRRTIGYSDTRSICILACIHIQASTVLDPVAAIIMLHINLICSAIGFPPAHIWCAIGNGYTRIICILACIHIQASTVLDPVAPIIMLHINLICSAIGFLPAHIRRTIGYSDTRSICILACIHIQASTVLDPVAAIIMLHINLICSAIGFLPTHIWCAIGHRNTRILCIVACIHIQTPAILYPGGTVIMFHINLNCTASGISPGHIRRTS